MKHLEDNLQEACCRWFAYQYPGYLLFAVPNGGKRNAREAARLKRQGVRPGVPDLFLAHTTATCGGLFIEMKSDKGKCSQVQKATLKELENNGYTVAVCHCFDEFSVAIKDYLK